MNDSPPLLEARGIGRLAGDRWLLRDISLTLSPGERLAIVGDSGAGKTLLLRALTKLDPIQEGGIFWSGNLVSSKDIPSFRSRMTYLGQKPVFPPASVRETLMQPFTLRIHQNRQYNESSITGWLETMGRKVDFLDKRTTDLSGGETQLVALLRVLQLNPAALLLDEPTSALDAHTVQAVEHLLSDWLDSGPHACIFVSHQREQVSRMGCRPLFLHEGRLHEQENKR